MQTTKLLAWNVMEQHISLNMCQINFVVNYISCISCHQQLSNTCYTQDFNFFFFLFPLISNFPVLAFPCLSSCAWQSWDSSVVVDFIGWQLELGSTFAKKKQILFWYTTHIFFFMHHVLEERTALAPINFDLYKSLVVI